MAQIAVGIIWVTMTFSQTLATTRFFERERENNTLRALLLSPIDRGAIYWAKLVTVLCFVALTAALVMVLVVVLFRFNVEHVGLLVLLLGLGVLGFAAVGSLFAIGLCRARSRDLLLAVLTFPVLVPVLIAGVRGTTAITLAPVDVASAYSWLRLLAAYDVIFVVLASYAFPALVRES